MIIIPTTLEISDSNVANYENKLGQDAPINDKAFINVQAAINALNFTQLYKFAVERSLQNLATTATGTDLEEIGAQYQINKKPSVSAVLTADLPAIDGTIISPTRSFVSVLTGIRYDVESQVVAAGGVATLTLVAQVIGVDGNLDPGAELTIDSPVAGAETTATVITLDITGTYEEKVRFAFKKSAWAVLYGLFRTKYLKKSIVTESFVGNDISTVLNLIKHGDIKVLDEIMFYHYDRGTGSRNHIEVAKIFATDFFSLIFPHFHLTRWCIKNLGINLFVKNMDYFIMINIGSELLLLMDVLRIGLLKINKLFKKKYSEEKI